MEEVKELEEMPKGELFKVKDPVNCPKDKHEWRMVQALQVECMKCHVGFYLPIGGELKNNHIQINGIEVV